MVFRLLSFFFLLSNICSGQDTKYTISAPLDFKEAGTRNSVLCMKNGNTLLFHIEQDKKLVVKVFDNAHREIASQKEKSDFVNFGNKDYSILALYDINDEAVMFVDRDLNSRHTLVRIRFNAHTGMIADESVVGESKSENRRMKFYLVKHIEDENYEDEDLNETPVFTNVSEKSKEFTLCNNEFKLIAYCSEAYNCDWVDKYVLKQFHNLENINDYKGASSKLNYLAQYIYLIKVDCLLEKI